MDSSSEISLLLRIRALESALSKCKRHRMIDAYYTRPQTKPQRPTHHDNDTLQIWITSISYVNYYQNIAHRLEGLKNLYESERLNRLGFRFPSAQQMTQETFVELESDNNSDDDDNSEEEFTEESSESGSQSDATSIATSVVTSIASTREKKGLRPPVSGKCPRKRPTTQTTESSSNENGDMDTGDTEDTDIIHTSPSDMSIVSQDMIEDGSTLNFYSGNTTPSDCRFTTASTSLTLPQSDTNGFRSPHFCDYGFELKFDT
ncbi:hypothetical protein BGZ76_001586 [Entomortierella beljakovae]|nr:hypothetical protein BGZ76_001586 [Entomortierella beljakovae]